MLDVLVVQYVHLLVLGNPQNLYHLYHAILQLVVRLAFSTDVLDSLLLAHPGY